MSEKHLTEPLWKALAAKHAIKDLGLGKALVAYNHSDATKEPGKALEALQEISELAVRLKKANPNKEEVVAHLDEVVKEVKKTTPALEAKVKSAIAATAATVGSQPTQAPAKPPTAPPQPSAKPTEEDDEEKEAAAFRKDLKQQMLSALAQVKARAPGDPQQEAKPQLQFMAYLVGKICAVIVSRKVGSATKKLLPEIVGGASGGKFIQGECRFEKNNHTFVLTEVPGGLAKKLSTALQTETEQKFKVRVRNTDGSVNLDSDTDVDPDAIPASQSPTPAAAPDEMVKFTARLKSLQPEVLKAIATQTPESNEIKQRAAEAGALAGKRDFAQAHKVLDAVEGLLKRIPAAPPGSPQPAAGAKTAPPKAPESKPDTAPREIKLSAYLNGRANLRKAKDNAATELKRLHEAILAACQGEAFYAQVQAKTESLLRFLDPIDDSVSNTLDEAGRCLDPELQSGLNRKVRDGIQKQLTALRNHPLAPFVKQNPFGSFNVTQPLEQTLTELDAQLAG